MIYVTNIADDTLSVIDGIHCNATITSGCERAPATIAVGHGPISASVDQSTNTIYVANSGASTVSIVAGRSCDRAVTSGCQRVPPTVAVGESPFGVAVNQTTSDAYVTSIHDSDVAVIHGAACSADTPRQCHAAVVPQRMGGWPGSVALDPRLGTGYVSNNVDGSVSLFRLFGR